MTWNKATGTLLLVASCWSSVAWADPCGGFSGDPKKICSMLLETAESGAVYVREARSASSCSSTGDGMGKALCYALGGSESRCQSSVPDYAASDKRDVCDAFEAFGKKLTAMDATNVSCRRIDATQARAYCEAVTEPSAGDCRGADALERDACTKAARFFERFWAGTIVTQAEALAADTPTVVQASTDPRTGTLESCTLSRCQATCDSDKPNAGSIKGFMADGTAFQCLKDQAGVDQACLSSSDKGGMGYLAGVCSKQRGWGRPVIEDFARKGPSYLTCTPALVGYYERYGYEAFEDGEGIGDTLSFRAAGIVVMSHR